MRRRETSEVKQSGGVNRGSRNLYRYAEHSGCGSRDPNRPLRSGARTPQRGPSSSRRRVDRERSNSSLEGGPGRHTFDGVVLDQMRSEEILVSVYPRIDGSAPLPEEHHPDLGRHVRGRGLPEPGVQLEGGRP